VAPETVGRSVASVRLALVIALSVLLAGLAASATSAVARGWMRPVDGGVLRAFSVGPDRFAAGQHRGVDLAAAPGARVLAACGGRVSFAGRVPGGGRTVSVRCGPLVSTYQHLGGVAVRRGQVVIAGGRIGTSGRARRGLHVHLGVRVAATGEYRDPLALFGTGPRAPLAPVPSARRAPPSGLPPGGRPLGPAPVARRVRVPLHLPAAPAVVPSPAHAPGAAAGRLPWAVWLGLGLVALGLPLGGGLLVARRRGQRRAGSGSARFEPVAPLQTPGGTGVPGAPG